MHRATHKRILHDRVLAMVRRIRRRWRTRIAVRGMAIVLGAGLLAFLLSVYGLEVSRFSASSVVTFRVILWLVGAGLTVRFLVWPLARRVSDEQAALYLEEHEPSLEASVLAALETSSGSSQASEALERRLVENALERGQRCRFWAPDRAEGSLPGIRTTRRRGAGLARVSAPGSESAPQRCSGPPYANTGCGNGEPVLDLREPW